MLASYIHPECSKSRRFLPSASLCSHCCCTFSKTHYTGSCVVAKLPLVCPKDPHSSLFHSHGLAIVKDLTSRKRFKVLNIITCLICLGQADVSPSKWGGLRFDLSNVSHFSDFQERNQPKTPVV